MRRRESPQVKVELLGLGRYNTTIIDRGESFVTHDVVVNRYYFFSRRGVFTFKANNLNVLVLLRTWEPVSYFVGEGICSCPLR